MTQLANYLKQEYPVKECDDNTWEFKVDDRDGDVAHEFCTITLTTGADPNQFTLTLFRVPTSESLLQLVQELEGEITKQRYDTTITLELSIKQVTAIRGLAKEIRRIVGPGKHYLIPNWWWICPRTANSLDKLATTLFEFRRAKRHGQLENVCEEEDEGLFALAE